MKKIVIGLGFGDEGKGLVVDWLALRNPDSTVVRYCGGHQAGHCVRIGEEKHIFSNFGCGTMRGLPTIWNAKTVDPVGFCGEYEDIRKWNPKIRVNPNCPVTTPLDKQENVVNENMITNGTVGVGFGSTIEREENHYHLFFADLFFPEMFRQKFEGIRRYYKDKIGFALTAQEAIEFVISCEKMIEYVDQDLRETPVKIYESSQGLMLDMEYGIFPNVTRSKVGTQEIIDNELLEFFLVTRAYQTRHGNGWCSQHRFIPEAKNETNKYDNFQGVFKTRLLDLDLLRYGLNIDIKIRESHPETKNLVITCLDHLSSKTGYALTNKGEVHYFDSENDFLGYIIKKLPNFKAVYVSRGPTAEDIELYAEFYKRR